MLRSPLLVETDRVRDRLTRLFLRYRDHRDGRALGRLFDRVAPRLLGVAAHLAPDLASAEDLVQATFLVALERARSFDPSREVEPWLYGILVREAARARRRRAQVPDARRVAREDVEPAPDAQLEERELQTLVVEALDRLPARYREVLAPYLCEGLSAVEIARRLERTSPLSAGHVRVLIGRGLEKLRRHLPAGVALGAAGALAVPRGHAALRAELLERAGFPRGELATASSLLAPSLAVGGLVVSKSTLLLGSAACAAALALLGLDLLRVAPREVPAPEPRSTRPSPASELELASPGELAGPTAPAAARRDVVPANDALAPAVVPAEVPPLAEVEVSVVDGNGTAVPFATLRGDLYSDWAASCDAHGRFSLAGPKRPGFIGAFHPDHAPSLALPPWPGEPLVLVMGGPAAGLDVVLVDESGAPVRDAQVLVGRHRQSPALTPDAREARTPLDVSERSDPEGRARLRGLTAGTQSVRVVAAGLVRVDTGFPLVAGEVRELSLVLRRGRRLTGRVTSSAGAPLAGVDIGVGDSRTRTDEDGSYTLAGIPREQVGARAALRGYTTAITALTPDRTDEVRWDPMLDPLRSIEGRVVDEHGAPLEDWWVLLHAIEPGSLTTLLDGDKPSLHTWTSSTRTDSAGHFVLGGVPPRDFRVSVRTPALWDRGAVLVVDDARAGETELLLRVPDAERPSGSLRGCLRHDADTWPRAATVGPFRIGDEMWFTRPVDEQGCFELSGLLPGRYELLLAPDGRFVTQKVPCEVRADEVTDLGIVQVPRPGVVRFRVSCPDQTPRGDMDYSIERIEAGQSFGGYQFAGPIPAELELVAGEYEVSLRCSHYRCEPARVQVRPDGNHTVELTLEPATRATFTFTAGDGPALEGEIDVRVLHPASGIELARHTARAGAPLVLDLDPLPYTLCATASDGRTGRLGGWFTGSSMPDGAAPFTIELRAVPDAGKQR